MENNKFASEFGSGVEKTTFEWLVPYLPTGLKVEASSRGASKRRD
jgi:hypothetical protein